MWPSWMGWWASTLRLPTQACISPFRRSGILFSAPPRILGRSSSPYRTRCAKIYSCNYLREPPTRSPGERLLACQSIRLGSLYHTLLRLTDPNGRPHVLSQNTSFQSSTGRLSFGQWIMPYLWYRAGMRSAGVMLRSKRRHWGKPGPLRPQRTLVKWDGVRGRGHGCQCFPPPYMGQS